MTYLCRLGYFIKYISNYIHSHQQMDPVFAGKISVLFLHSTQEPGDPWDSQFHYFEVLQYGSSHE